MTSTPAPEAHAGIVPHPSTPHGGLQLAVYWTTAVLVVAQAVVVGLQVVGRHLFRHPIPWTEEIARLLLVWLMCAGGIGALANGQHPRVTALVRLLRPDRRDAVDRGLRIVLLLFFVGLIGPAWRLTVTSAAERLPASGLSGAAISAVLPVALVLMAVVVVQQLWRGAAETWRDRALLGWSAGAAALAIASVLIPLLADAPPLVVLVTGFLTTAALGMPLAFTLALTALTYLLGIGGVGLIILPIKILGGVDSFVLLAIPLFVLAGALMESGGISERIVDLAMAIVGRVRGGLAMVAVVAEVLFSGISGSTAADVSAISSLLVPSMRRAGYSGPESVSVVAAASAMGILVPPCLTMVVLGSLVNLSIVTLFLAGFLPAFVLAAALLVLIALRARRQRWPVTGPVRPRAPGARGEAGGGAARTARAAVRRHFQRRDHGDGSGAARGRLRARGRDDDRRHPARRVARAAGADRNRDGDDPVGAGRGLGVRLDPGARVGAADARRMDGRSGRRPLPVSSR